MFFFFKQKTAYEMRISDWSSDVCSSDLLRPLPRIGGAERRLGEDIVVIFVDDRALDDRRAVVQQRGNDAARVELSVFRRVMLELEIGRASCRDRVCQYVLISVVAVSLKNKKKLTNR